MFTPKLGEDGAILFFSRQLAQAIVVNVIGLKPPRAAFGTWSPHHSGKEKTTSSFFLVDSL